MDIFIEMNPAYLIALMFFLICGGYIYLAAQTILSDYKSKLHWEHLTAVTCVVFSSLFYGLMTVAGNETALKFFWAVGFVSYSMFLPTWLRFTSNMVKFRFSLTRPIFRVVLIAVSFFISLLCVLSDRVVFKSTPYGNQFSFNGSLLFQIMVVYVFLLCIAVVASHIKWWRESTVKRQRKQQSMFVLLTFLLAPIGFVTDFFIPAFTDSTVIPLVSVLLFPASLQLYISMRINRTLSITVPNVSSYIFRSVTLPVLVLDHNNMIKLENRAALDFFGNSLVDVDISEIITNEELRDEHFFESDHARNNVTIDTLYGTKVCDILLTIEVDKYDEALCKVLLFRDITELKQSFARLEAINSMSFTFLTNTEEAFADKMTAGVKVIADLLDLDSISVWRNSLKSDGMYTSQIYDWDCDEGGTAETEEHFIDVPLVNFSSDWDAIMSGRKVINGPVNKLEDPVTAQVFENFGIVSAFVAPISVNNQYWGFVMFENRRYSRVFDENAIEAMRSAAYLCVNTVIREEMESDLATALKEATSANQAKSYFLANMSHEMRTPMNAIIGMSHIGKASDDPGQKDYSLNRIDEASKHLLGIINDVLDMSKIEAGKFELWKSDFCIETMLHRVVNVVRLRADEKEQTIMVDVSSDIPESFTGDEQRLAQVITNLAGNAIKFTPEKGYIDITVKLLREENNICTIQIDIADTGIGIGLEQKEKLFDSFHQVEGSSTRNFGGTGLGLAISKNIVEMMGGKIWVESEVGNGSTFSFTIDLIRNDDTEYELGVQSPDSQPDDELIGKTFENRHVLLVEDIDINREIALALLEQTLVKVSCAENGAEAYHMFAGEQDKYDLIFMDLQMPKMDGYEATQKIRALGTPKAKKIPIIAMTANVFREDIEKCIASGMNDHIGKPIAVHDIISKMSKYL